MHLEYDEVVVTPPQYRLFECMRVRVCLIPKDDTQALDVDSLWQAKVSLGMIVQEGHVEAVTEDFRFGDIPKREEALHYWNRVHSRVPSAKPGRSILIYLKHLSGVQVEFPLKEAEMQKFIVHLGAFQVTGELPNGFVFSTYFGETSKLED